MIAGQEAGARLPDVMSGNLVIVESPAKAKTIERYLGPGYRVLASYGHVRDLPEKLGKDQLGVDVEHDFAPSYEIVADRRKQVAEIAKAARGADTVFLATDLDREGEAIAWHVAQAAGLVPARTRRVTFSEITEGGDPRGLRPSPRDRPRPGRCPAGPPDRGSPGRLHAQPAALAEGPLGPVRRPGPVGRGPARGRPRARDPGVHGGRVLDDRDHPARAGRDSVQRRPGPARPGKARDRRRGDRPRPRRCAARRPAGRARRRGEAIQAQPGAAVHHLHPPAGGEPQAELQPQADDVRRPAAVRGPGDGRRPGRPHHLHADGLGGPVRARRWAMPAT